MGLKENDYLNWSGAGYTSFDEAKAAVGKIMEKMPEFLINENLSKTITQDLNTGIISARIQASSSSEDEEYGW